MQRIVSILGYLRPSTEVKIPRRIVALMHDDKGIAQVPLSHHDELRIIKHLGQRSHVV